MQAFRKHIGRNCFAENIHLNGIETDLVVIGFDSTSSPFPNWFDVNLGSFDEERSKWFNKEVERLRNQEMGALDYDSAFKIALIHHHPLPTMSSKGESMLYLRNAGNLLSTLEDQKFDIVLHGHQHDPCNYSINYNQGSDEDFLIILSAGTASKSEAMPKWEKFLSTVFTLSSPSDRQLAKDGDILLDTAIYYFKIDREFIEVEQFNFNDAKACFLPQLGFRKLRRKTSMSHYSRHYVYYVKANGDCIEHGTRSISCMKGRSQSQTELYFGVDHGTPELLSNTISGLQLKVLRSNSTGTHDITSHATLTTNEPRWKVIRVQLDPPIGTNIEDIKWEHVWPRGWENFIKRGQDLGSYNAPVKTNEFSVELRFDSNLKGFISDVSYAHHRLNDAKTKFHVTNLPKNRIVDYHLKLR